MHTTLKGKKPKVVLITFYDHDCGVRALSSYLKSKGVDTNIIFCPLQSRVEIYALDSRRPGIPTGIVEGIAALAREAVYVGISLMTKHFEDTAILVRELKARLPQVPVLLGGIHASSMPEQCVEIADYACVGEGYEPAAELARRLQAGERYPAVPGICFKRDGEVVINKAGPPVKDIDTLPFLDYEIAGHYMRRGDAIVPLTAELYARNMGFWYTTFFTQGCPMDCSFCCNSLYHDMDPAYRRIRKHSPAYIVDEIKYARERMPFIRMVKFNDDCFLSLRPDEMREFARLKKSAADLPFVATGINPLFITDEKIGTLVEAGLRRIRVGVQTGSERVLADIYQRRVSNQQIVRASEIIARHAKRMVPTAYDFIVDSPWDGPEEQAETLAVIRQLHRPYVVNMFALRLYPRTALWERARREGKLDDKGLASGYKKNYFFAKSTYFNFLLTLEGTMAVPNVVRKVLHAPRLLRAIRQIPSALFKTMLLLTGVKRVFIQARRGDIVMLPYHLARWMPKAWTR